MSKSEKKHLPRIEKSVTDQLKDLVKEVSKHDLKQSILESDCWARFNPDWKALSQALRVLNLDSPSLASLSLSQWLLLAGSQTSNLPQPVRTNQAYPLIGLECCAALAGNLEAVQALIAANPGCADRLTGYDQHHRSILWYAFESGNFQVVKKLIQQLPKLKDQIKHAGYFDASGETFYPNIVHSLAKWRPHMLIPLLTDYPEFKDHATREDHDDNSVVQLMANSEAPLTIITLVKTFPKLFKPLLESYSFSCNVLYDIISSGHALKVIQLAKHIPEFKSQISYRTFQQVVETGKVTHAEEFLKYLPRLGRAVEKKFKETKKFNKKSKLLLHIGALSGNPQMVIWLLKTFPFLKEQLTRPGFQNGYLLEHAAIAGKRQIIVDLIKAVPILVEQLKYVKRGRPVYLPLLRHASNEGGQVEHNRVMQQLFFAPPNTDADATNRYRKAVIKPFVADAIEHMIKKLPVDLAGPVAEYAGKISSFDCFVEKLHNPSKQELFMRPLYFFIITSQEARARQNAFTLYHQLVPLNKKSPETKQTKLLAYYRVFLQRQEQSKLPLKSELHPAFPKRQELSLQPEFYRLLTNLACAAHTCGNRSDALLIQTIDLLIPNIYHFLNTGNPDKAALNALNLPIIKRRLLHYIRHSNDEEKHHSLNTDNTNSEAKHHSLNADNLNSSVLDLLSLGGVDWKELTSEPSRRGMFHASTPVEIELQPKETFQPQPQDN